MRKNHYESVVIINATLEDDQIENIISRIKETITSNGGEIANIDNWGRKRLAYPIQKSKSGYYSVIRFSAPVALIAILERVYRLDETIIRYLTISLDKRALEHIQKQSEKAEAADTEEANTETANTEEVTNTEKTTDVTEVNEEKNN